MVRSEYSRGQLLATAASSPVTVPLWAHDWAPGGAAYPRATRERADPDSCVAVTRPALITEHCRLSMALTTVLSVALSQLGCIDGDICNMSPATRDPCVECPVPVPASAAAGRGTVYRLGLPIP